MMDCASYATWKKERFMLHTYIQSHRAKTYERKMVTIHSVKEHWGHIFNFIGSSIHTSNLLYILEVIAR